MANPLKKIVQDQIIASPKAATSSKPVAVTYGQHSEVASPARDLMSQLEVELSYQEAAEEKYPLKWTVLGVTLFCGLSWYAILSLIF
jgi:hypothetical protein